LSLAQPDPQRRQDVRAITLALFSERERFRCDRSLPERWSLAANSKAAVEAASQVTSGRAAAFDRSRLYAWQRDALVCWEAAQHCGVVEAVTGSGKTMLGVAAAADELARRGQVLVIVPTVELMHQWHRHMVPVLPPGYLIGCLGDGETGSFATCDIIVGVVNSLRGNDLRMTRRGGLLVADECHRYASVMNRLALDQRFERRLGLSATYARDDDGHVNWLDPFFRGRAFGWIPASGRRWRHGSFHGRLGWRRTACVRTGDLRELTSQIGPRHARLMQRYQLRLPLSASSSGAEPARLRCPAATRPARVRPRLPGPAARTPPPPGWHVGEDANPAGLAPAIASADRSIVFTGSIAAADVAVLTLTTLVCGLSPSTRGSQRRTAARCSAFAEGDLQVISAPAYLTKASTSRRRILP